MQAVKAIDHVTLSEDTLSPSEVRDLVLKLIDDQINFYKVKNLCNWVKDHNTNQEIYGRKIAQLEARKQEVKEMIAEAKQTGCNLKLCQNLDVSFDR